MRCVPVLWVLAFCAAASAQDDNGAATHPDWSPDGKWLAFEANRDGARNVHIMRVDGSEVRQLTFNDAMDTYPRFSPDGRSLVFLSRRSRLFSMHLVHVGGGEERALLPADGNLEPAFSPDGLSVAFRSYLGGDDADGEIMIVGVAGDNLRQLTSNDVEDGYPVFSADGRSLFFHRSVGAFRQIVVMDLESGAEIQLTEGGFDSWHAHPSPDGQAIVYDANPGGNRDIYVMDLRSRQARRLTTHPGRDGYPKYSPDGRRIAFHSDRDGATAVYVMDIDGSGQVPVTPDWPSASADRIIRSY